MSHDSKPLDGCSSPTAPKARTYAAVAICCVVSGLIVAKFGVDMLVEERRVATLEAVEQRLAARARGKVELIETWVDGLSSLGNRMLRSDLVRLFVTEMALRREDVELEGALEQQKPYMRQVLDDMASQHDLRGAYLLSRDGHLLLGDRDAPMLSAEQLSAAHALGSSGALRQLSAPHPAGDRLLMEVYQAIEPAQSLAEHDTRPVGVLLMTFDVTAMLQKLLASEPALYEGESTELAMLAGDARVRLSASRDSVVVDVEEAGDSSLVQLGRLELIDGSYRLREQTPALGWQVEQRIESGVVHRPLETFALAAYGFAAASAVIVSLLFSSFFWRLESRHQTALVAQYRALAERIRAQNTLLRTVTESTLDLVTLKSADGRYQLVSSAYARSFDRLPEQLVGWRDEDLLEPDTCAELAAGERDARAIGVSLRDDLVVSIAGTERHLHVVQVPVDPSERSSSAMLMVARDITELVHAREEREHLSRQMVDAFVRAVELVDPYLEGHTQRLAALSTELACILGLDSDELRTIELAARLSQIGKMFVPREIVAKPERHTEEEALIMRSHIAHARRVLAGISFGRPVARSLAQMHERLDGSGYPDGLAGDAIELAGRILAVADVFCARTRPRSYRDRLADHEAARILSDASDRYDPRVTAALAEIVQKSAHASDPATPVIA